MTRKDALDVKGLKAARFHEIMDVANLRTGGQVDYNPDATNPYQTGYNRKRSIDGDNMDTQDEVRESVEQYEEQGSRGGSEDSGVSLQPKAPEGESSSKNTMGYGQHLRSAQPCVTRRPVMVSTAGRQGHTR